VFALITAARDVVAVSTVLFVFALTDAVPAAIDAASDVEALPTMVLVLVLTAEVIPEVCALVLLFTKVATDVLAVVMSESVASDPDVRPAAVRVLVVAAQMSDTTPESDVRVLDENDQIDAGRDAARDELADATSEAVASDPAFKVAAVNVRVAAAQMSDATDASEVTVLEEKAHIEAGRDAPSDEDAVKIAAFVLVFTPETVVSRLRRI